MKKISLAAAVAIFAAAFCAKAQDGLSVGGGYRGFLNPIFMNENVKKTDNYMCPQHGFFLAVDYNCEELLGPLDLNVGIDIARLMYFYIRQEHDEWVGTENNLATLDMQIPLRVRWTCDVSDDFKFFLQAGPVFDLGLTLKDGMASNVDYYKMRVNLFKTGIYETTDAGPGVYNRQHPVYGQVDCFLGGGIGFILWNNFRVMVNADWGAVNRLKSYGDFEDYITDKGVSTSNSHNIQLNVSFAYCFD